MELVCSLGSVSDGSEDGNDGDVVLVNWRFFFLGLDDLWRLQFLG